MLSLMARGKHSDAAAYTQHEPDILLAHFREHLLVANRGQVAALRDRRGLSDGDGTFRLFGEEHMRIREGAR